jgi:hypothetical protein
MTGHNKQKETLAKNTNTDTRRGCQMFVSSPKTIFQHKLQLQLETEARPLRVKDADRKLTWVGFL